VRAGQPPLTARRQACHHQGRRPARRTTGARSAMRSPGQLLGADPLWRPNVEQDLRPPSPRCSSCSRAQPGQRSRIRPGKGKRAGPVRHLQLVEPGSEAYVGVELDQRRRCQVRFRVRRGNPAPVLGRSWDRSACPSKQSSGCGNYTRTIALDRTAVLVLNSKARTTVLSTPTKADRHGQPDFQDHSPPLPTIHRLLTRQTGRSL
jgi:hypothetical protein